MDCAELLARFDALLAEVRELRRVLEGMPAGPAESWARPPLGPIVAPAVGEPRHVIAIGHRIDGQPHVPPVQWIIPEPVGDE